MLGAALVAVVATLAWRARTNGAAVEPPVRASFDWVRMAEALDGVTFERPDTAPVALPTDFSPHPETRAGVWSLRGVLRDDKGQAHVLDALALRAGIGRKGETDEPFESAWRASAGWIARVRLAQAGVETPLFLAERVQRESVMALAGRSSGGDGFDVAGARLQASTADAFTLVAQAGGRALAVDARASKPMRASEARGPFKGFSFTRLELTAHIGSGDDATVLHGTGWFERAWGELPLPGGATRVERISLQLDDGEEWLISRTQRRGSTRVRVRAVSIAADGSSNAVDRNVELARDGEVWRLTMGPAEFVATLTPLDAGGAGVLGVRAVVEVQGTHAGRSISGFGYAELEVEADDVT